MACGTREPTPPADSGSRACLTAGISWRRATRRSADVFHDAVSDRSRNRRVRRLWHRLSRSSVRGVVRTDAGSGLPGVLVHDRRRRSPGHRRAPADDGTFVAEGLPAGIYDVSDRGGLGSRRISGRHPRASARCGRGGRAGPGDVRAAAVPQRLRPRTTLQSRERSVRRVGGSDG